MVRGIGLVLCVLGFVLLQEARRVPVAAQGRPAAVASTVAEVPRAIRRACEAGTRDTTGGRGASYWQLQTDYTINAHLDPETDTITGTETIALHNDSLEELEPGRSGSRNGSSVVADDGGH